MLRELIEISIKVAFVSAFVGVVMGAQAEQAKALFAGGCFWCMQGPFEKSNGVAKVVSGYTGGTGQNPTYEDYAAKGQVEAIEVTYDPSKITYDQLLQVFWRQIDPTDPDGQFVDRGPQYRSAIFYENDEQKNLAEKSKAELAKSRRYDKPVVTEIIRASTFYPAEEYHQDYYKKNPIRYHYYRARSGRDQYLKKIWGTEKNTLPTQEGKTPAQQGKAGFVKPGNEKLMKTLTPLQYKVTQEQGTEPPFHNEYWNNERPGIYVDIVSGEPLYSSLDKFDSGTGWPSFTKPLEPSNIVEKVDKSFFSTRTEVRSKLGNNHLGHVFDDGPKPTGLRYCMNSAALRFIPAEDLEKDGYVQYVKLFEKAGVK